MYSTTRSMDSTDEGLYESLPGDYEYLSDDEEINLESFSMEKKEVKSAASSRKCLEIYDNRLVEVERHVSSGYGMVRKNFKTESMQGGEYEGSFYGETRTSLNR